MLTMHFRISCGNPASLPACVQKTGPLVSLFGASGMTGIALADQIPCHGDTSVGPGSIQNRHHIGRK